MTERLSSSLSLFNFTAESCPPKSVHRFIYYPDLRMYVGKFVPGKTRLAVDDAFLGHEKTSRCCSSSITDFRAGCLPVGLKYSFSVLLVTALPGTLCQVPFPWPFSVVYNLWWYMQQHIIYYYDWYQELTIIVLEKNSEVTDNLSIII